MQPETKYAKSGDVHVAYQVLGNGPIDLVIVPGWVSHIELVWEEPQAAAVLRLLEALEEDDDVQQVYANFDIPADVLERISASV